MLTCHCTLLFLSLRTLTGGTTESYLLSGSAVRVPDRHHPLTRSPSHHPLHLLLLQVSPIVPRLHQREWHLGQRFTKPFWAQVRRHLIERRVWKLTRVCLGCRWTFTYDYFVKRCPEARLSKPSLVSVRGHNLRNTYYIYNTRMYGNNGILLVIIYGICKAPILLEIKCLRRICAKKKMNETISVSIFDRFGVGLVV